MYRYRYGVFVLIATGNNNTCKVVEKVVNYFNSS